MNILIVITKGDSGGAQMSVLNLARELRGRQHQVVVGLGTGDFLPDELDKEKIAYHRFKYLKRTKNPFANLLFAFEMKKFLKNKDLDIVHFNSSNALFGALGVKMFDKRLKTVFTFRGMSMLDEHHEMHPIFKKLYFLFFKFFLKFIDKPVFVSRENMTKAREAGLVEKGEMVYNGLNPHKIHFYEKEQAIKLLEQFGVFLDEKDYIIGSIGRLVYVKNYEFLINVY